MTRIDPARTTGRRRPAKAAVGVLAGLVALPLAALAVSGSPAAVAADPELTVNGSFENGLTGWQAGSTQSKLATTTERSVTGRYSARLTAKNANATIVLDDAANTVTSTVAGATYTVSAFVRTSGKHVPGQIQVQEKDGSSVVASEATDFTSTWTWTRVSTTYVAKTTGAQLDIKVAGLKAPLNAGLFIDDVSVTRSTPAADVQRPTAVRRSNAKGVVDAAYATGTADTKASRFVTTVDGVVVDDTSVAAPNGAGGYTAELPEDFSGGLADVVVAANGEELLTFQVDTDQVTQTPLATRASSAEGVVDVTYATGAGDTKASRFVTTVDGVVVDDVTVAAPNGKGRYTNSLAEDFSDGLADVEVSANGTPILSFQVDTDKVAVSSAPAPLLGMSAPADVWSTRKAQVEAAGGKLQARRIFLGSLTTSTTLIKQAHAEGLLPVVSYKVGNDWAGVASGKHDSKLTSIASTLKALNKPVVVALHHEPDTQATPADVGEGGSASDFAAMYRHAIPLLKTAPNVQVAAIMNGWWWSSEKRRLTDAQMNVWLPSDVRKSLDVIAADDYSPQGGEPSVVKTRNRVAWAKRVGDVKSLGIGEFNGYKPSDIADVLDLVRTEPLFRGGWALVWNSTAGGYLPLDQTGLLDDFQGILAGWSR